jgi:hypothetical protein
VLPCKKQWSKNSNKWWPDSQWKTGKISLKDWIFLGFTNLKKFEYFKVGILTGGVTPQLWGSRELS